MLFRSRVQSRQIEECLTSFLPFRCGKESRLSQRHISRPCCLNAFFEDPRVPLAGWRDGTPDALEESDQHLGFSGDDRDGFRGRLL